MSEFGAKIGFHIAAGLSLPLATSVTRESDGLNPAFAVALSYSANAKTQLSLGVLRSANTTEVKQIAGVGSEQNITEVIWAVSAGRFKRTPLGEPDVIARVGSYQELNIGSASVSTQPSLQEVLGSEVEVSRHNRDGLFYVSREAGLQAALTPGRFQVGARAGLRFSTAFDEEGSEYNRFGAEVHAGLFLGMTDEDTDIAKDEEWNLTEKLYYSCFLKPHQVISRWQTDKVLTRPNKKLEAAEFLGSGSGDPGPLQDTSTLYGGLTYLSGSEDVEAFLKSGDWRWGVLGEQVLGAGFALGTEQYGAGLGDILTAGSMLLYTVFDIDSPEKRARFATQAILHDNLIQAAFIRWGINSTIFLAGASLESETAALAGASANIGLSRAPLPIEDQGPSLTFLAYNGGTHDGRVRLGNITPLGAYSALSADLTSHGLLPGNAAQTISHSLGDEEDVPYVNTIAPTTVGSTLFFGYFGKNLLTGIGPRTAASFGTENYAELGAAALIAPQIWLTDNFGLAAVLQGNTQRELGAGQNSFDFSIGLGVLTQ